jgi:hypothetical protein
MSPEPISSHSLISPANADLALTPGRGCRIARACLLWLLVSACGGSTDAPPGSGSGETITGAERFGWEQPASDAGELASFRYAFYVDNSRTEATDVSCGSTATSDRFACTCGLPVMASGSHTLQVAAFVIDASTTRESPRSAAVRVIKQ